MIGNAAALHVPQREADELPTRHRVRSAVERLRRSNSAMERPLLALECSQFWRAQIKQAAIDPPFVVTPATFSQSKHPEFAEDASPRGKASAFLDEQCY